MTEDRAQQQLLAFNFHYLTLLQRQLMADPLRARYVFNLDETMAALLTSLDSYQLLELSNTHRALCDFTYSDPNYLQQLLDSPDHLQDACRTHATILKISQRHSTPKTIVDPALWGDQE